MCAICLCDCSSYRQHQKGKNLFCMVLSLYGLMTILQQLHFLVCYLNSGTSAFVYCIRDSSSWRINHGYYSNKCQIFQREVDLISIETKSRGKSVQRKILMTKSYKTMSEKSFLSRGWCFNCQCIVASVLAQ